MTINIDFDTEKKLDLDFEAIIRDIIAAAIEYEHCPYECELSVMITDDDGIHELNRRISMRSMRMMTISLIPTAGSCCSGISC